MRGVHEYLCFEDPRSLIDACLSSADFEAAFGTEELCRITFERARWPGGFRCPACMGAGRWLTERRGYECRGCRKFTSLTAGTLLHGTRKPLRKWFEALYLVVQRGVNAKTLQRAIGLTYKVAWSWGHKLRSLLAGFAVPGDLRRPRERSHKEFEAARVSGGPPVRAPRRGDVGPCGCRKLLERDWRWPDELAEEREAARIWRLYRLGTPSNVLWPPREHAPEEPRHGDDRAHHELLGTYFGSVSEKHLRGYLDELAFRMNRRWRATDESFLLIAPALAGAGPRPYREIVARPDPEGHPLSIYDVRQ